MGRNYQLETDALLRGLSAKQKPSLLLHCCCAPCASYVLEYLRDYFDIGVYFYNPNIYPEVEYEKRLRYLKMLLDMQPDGSRVRLIEAETDLKAFEEIAKGRDDQPEGGERCKLCVTLRLNKTAEMAAKIGFEYCCTTLTVGPRKDAGIINEAGMSVSERHGVSWLPSDFKKRGGFQRSVELSREFGLYRQSYCGCLPFFQER